MYDLTKRKGSNNWYFRKRWPTDVVRILGDEFVKSTREGDKRAAEGRLPVLMAEYHSRIDAARTKLAEVPPATLSESQALAMAAQFYRAALPSYIVTRPIGQHEQRQLLDDTRSRLAAAQDALGRNEFTMVVPSSRTVTRQAGVELPDDSPAMDLLRRHLMLAFIELMRAAVARLEGGPDYVPQGLPLDAPSAAHSSPSTPVRTVNTLIDEYEADKGAGWSVATKRAFEPVARLLRDVFGDRDVGGIARDDAKELRKLLERLPVNIGRQKALEGLTIPQAVAKAQKLGLPTIQPKTVNSKYIVTIAAVFNWAKQEQWIASTPFGGLMVHDPVAPEDKRDRFEVDQLTTIFSSGPWRSPWADDGRKAGAFWVPLLAAFHGLRNAEAAGLRVEDVGEDGGIPVLHVRPYEGRSLKTSGARGMLPVHPQLLALGFMAFVAERREAGAAVLFADGAATKGREVGANLGTWFSRHVRQLKLEGRKLGMHSFRHGFEDALRSAKLPDRTALALARRSEAGSSKVYGSGMSARQLAGALEKIAYHGLDLSHLKRPDATLSGPVV